MTIDPEVLTTMMREKDRPWQTPSETIYNIVPTNERPMVTREQYDRAREVLDALPSGVYVKCLRCQGWYTDGTVNFNGVDVFCERCA